MSELPVRFDGDALQQRILVLRGERVMVDSDLAELYGVTTKRFNEQVKRNLERFPVDFMFQLTAEEKALAANVAQARSAYDQQGLRPAIAALKANDWAETSRINVELLAPLYAKLRASLEPLAKLQVAEAKKEYDDSVTSFETFRIVAIPSIVIG
mgnify:CR=1 FL=1